MTRLLPSIVLSTLLGAIPIAAPAQPAATPQILTQTDLLERLTNLDRLPSHPGRTQPNHSRSPATLPQLRA